jgi:hypothetical protein
MDRFAGDGEAPSSPVFEGWNIGAVSVKRVRLHHDGKVEADIRRHGGDPSSAVHSMLDHDSEPPGGAIVRGRKPYRS